MARPIEMHDSVSIEDLTMLNGKRIVAFRTEDTVAVLKKAMAAARP